MKTTTYIIPVLALALFACHSTQKLEQKKDTTATELSIAEKADSDQVITEKYWKLIELGGNTVVRGEQQPKEAHFILKKETSRIVGNSGCNQFSGDYELSDGNRIRFSRVISTKMACMDMTLEHLFLEVLANTDNYSLKNDTLSLNRARMAPLARFVAVNFY